MDGSWLVVDDKDSYEEEQSGSNDSRVEKLSESNDGHRRSSTRGSSPQERSEQRLIQHIRSTVSSGLSSSAQFNNRPISGSPPGGRPLSHSVMDETDAFRLEAESKSPVAKAAEPVEAWGRQQEAVEESRRVRDPSTSLPSAQPRCEASSQAAIPAAPASPTLCGKTPSVITSGGSRGGNWGLVRPPVSPAGSPAGLRPLNPDTPGIPAISIGNGACKPAEHEQSQPNSMQQVAVAEQDDDAIDMCWTVAKYALVLGGSLYIGNNLRHRLSSNA